MPRVECERLAHTVNYDTLYFHNELNSNNNAPGAINDAEKPAFVLMATDIHKINEEKVAILAIRGTQTIHDIVTDLRAISTKTR